MVCFQLAQPLGLGGAGLPLGWVQLVTAPTQLAAIMNSSGEMFGRVAAGRDLQPQRSEVQDHLIETAVDAGERRTGLELYHGVRRRSAGSLMR